MTIINLDEYQDADSSWHDYDRRALF